MQLEYFVECYTDFEELPQFIEIDETKFVELLNVYKKRGIDPRIEYDRFTMFDNGRSGSRLTLVDSWVGYYVEG